MEEEVKYLDWEGLLLYHRNLENKLAEKANAADLADVATTGDYGDLINSPTNVSVFNNDAGYITSEIDNTNGHEFVEIGGLKWATMNIGAESVTDAGLYFQWGDIEGYTAEEVGVEKNFIWDDYKFNPSGDGSTFTKYNATDEKTSLDLEDDPVAHAWGSDWRTPTYEEFQAFEEAVDTEWTDDYEGSGIAGLICTDKEDSSKVIFFPAAGLCSQGSIISDTTEGFYYTKSLSNTVSQGIGIGFDDSTVNWNLSQNRCLGYCIRGILNGPATRTIMGVTLAEKDIWNAKVSTEELEEAVEAAELSAGKGIVIENNTVSIDDTVPVVITISSAPNNSTLTYTIGQTQYNFKVGDEVRVPDLNVPTGNHGYIYYKLFDLVTIEQTTTAFWCAIGAGSSEGGTFYTPTLNSEPTESTLTYTKDGQTLAFEIGQFCRVADANAPLGYKFYQLYDLAQNGTVAKWNAQAVKIAPSYTAPTAPLTTPVYNGSPQPILEGGSSGDGEVQYSLDGINWSNEVPTVTDAGEYTVYWRLVGDGVHSDIPTTEITVTVNPKVLDNPDILLSIDTYTYNGEACTPVVTIKDGDDVLTSDLYIVTYSDNTNAGTATVTVTDSGKNYSFSASTTFTIDKANGTVTTAPVNRASTYNGNALPVADAGTGTGTMMYRIGNTGDFSTTMPTATNADTYTLYYYAAESANYLLSATEYIQVTIVKANPTYSSPTAKTLTYTGSSQDLLNAGSTSDGTIQYSSDGGSTWSTSIPQGVDAGDYTPQWKLVGDSNHNDVSATTINVTIAKAVPSYTTPTGISGLIYDATAQDLLNAGTTSDGTISYSDDNETWSSTIPKGTNADTYSVYWKLDGDSNHTDIASTIINVNIAKVTPTVTAPTAKTLTYNTQSQELLNAGSTNWGILKYSNNGTNYETTIPAETNAGTYTLYYKVEGDSNINDVAPVEISATIAKVTPTVTAPTAKTGLIYSSLAQDLINAGSTDYGTLQYSLDDVTYSTSIPQGTNAGSYSVYYRVVGDSNINDVVATSVSVSIAKVTPTVVAPTPKVLTFDGTAQELIDEGSVDFGTLQYKVGADSWSTSVPTRINGGSYELLYRVVGDSNINDVASDSVVCSISEKSITATVELSQNSYTYDGTEKEPTVTVKDGSTVIDPSEYSVSYSNNINAGTATVTIYDNTGGDYDVVGSATFTITKAAGSVTTAPTAKSLKYNTTAQTLANAGSGTGTMYYSLSEDSDFSTTIPTGTNVGSYTVYYYAAESANYLQSATSSISVTIGKGDGSVSTAPTAKTLTYSGSALTLANAGSGTGTMYYSLNSSSGFSTTIPTGTDAGSYTVYYYAAESDSYNQSTTGNISVSIGKADPTYTAPTAKSLTYSGSAQALLNAGSTSHGTIQYSSDNSSWSTTIPTGTNANTYTSYWRIVGDSNHNDKASASISTTIGKADQNAPTATGASVTYGNTATATASGGGGQGSIEWSNGNTLTGNAGGSKTTKARWAGNSNYNASGWSNEVTLSITKANQSAPTAYGATTIYSTTATATASGGGGQGSIEWSNGNTQTSVGSKSTQARWSGNSNYNASGWSNSVTITMNKASGSVTTAPTNRGVTYNGSNQNLVNAGSGTGTMYYKLNSGSWSTSIPQASTAGSYTVYYYAAASTNYNLSSTGSLTATIGKANRTLSWSTAPTSVGWKESFTVAATPSAGSGDGAITYSSSNTNIATVSGSTVTTQALGSCTIYASIAAGTNYNSASTSYTITVVAKHKGYEFIDLGLSDGSKWAKWNVGATTETGYGNYYSWGYSTPFSSSDAEIPVSSEGDAAGTSMDSATLTMGGLWHLPTLEQYYKLRDECTRTYTDVNGVHVIKLTGPNGNYIILPHAGSAAGGNAGIRGRYWLSKYGKLSSRNTAYPLYLYFEESSMFSNRATTSNKLGHSVRGVIG